MIMKKAWAIIVLSVLTTTSFLVTQPVLADGMLIAPDPYADRWDYSSENNQQAFINYENGSQKMIISIGMENEDNKAVVWVFPVPADPNKVTIDIIEDLPRFSGEEISGMAQASLDTARDVAQISQLYTIMHVARNRMGGYTNSYGVGDAMGIPIGAGGAGRDPIEPDVVVYDHLEKDGVTSEIVTAKTTFGLYEYFKDKGLTIENGAIPVLDSYIGKEYSFIASWVSADNVSSPEAETSALQKSTEFLLPEAPRMFPPDEFGSAPSKKQKEIGMVVTFPTKEMYFPLLPTSVYGDRFVPATIRVVGHVTPQLFKDIARYTETEYYVDGDTKANYRRTKGTGRVGIYAKGYYEFFDDADRFLSTGSKDIKYTKITITAPSKFLTDDLWIKKTTPLKTYYTLFFAKYSVVSAILLLIIISMLAGIATGWIVFEDLRKKWGKLAMLGLSNILSIVGLMIVTVFEQTKEKIVGTEALLAEIKSKGYFWRRKLAVILFFIDLPFLLCLLLLVILPIGFGGAYSYSDFGRLTVASLLPLLIYFIPLLVLIICGLLKRVKKADRELFVRLKAFGYSVWSFHPKDKMKIVFVPLYSILFLVLTWAVIELIRLTI